MNHVPAGRLDGTRSDTRRPFTAARLASSTLPFTNLLAGLAYTDTLPAPPDTRNVSKCGTAAGGFDTAVTRLPAR
ncbi:MAG TPA: hypothetical protein VMU39_26615 [Solirubrobacteraceae bacterium]|nr:hypothetical protein [Solirubrobacteraceae bacterium]